MSRRVVVTGASGLIGRVLAGELGDFELKPLDRTGLGFGKKTDMTKLEAIRSLFEDQDCAIDLAANPSATAAWDEVYGNNLLTTYNALEASRGGGVRRVVFASSNHVTGLYENDEPYAAIVAGRYDALEPQSLPLIRTDSPIRPDGLYAVGKAFGEALGRFYAEAYDLSVICLRIGTVNDTNRPRSARHFATLLTHGDLGRLVRAAIEAPADVSYGVFYGVSNNTWRFWDIADAARLIGYEPQDDAEQWRSSHRPGAAS